MLDQVHAAGNTCAQKFFTTAEKIAYLHGLLDLGYHIFPLHDLAINSAGPHCGCRLGGRCPGPGKHPLSQWSKPLDPADPQSRRYIENIVTEWPDRGWGLHVGLSGLCVLDVDPRNGGVEGLRALQQRLGLELLPPTVHTGGGGEHYYFRAPASCDPRRGLVGRNGASRCTIQLVSGVEIFFGQHYVVLPMSPHASGGWYIQGGSGPAQALPTPLDSHLADNPAFVGGPATSAAQVPGGGLGNPPSHVASDGPSRLSEARARAWLGKRDPAVSGHGGRRQSTATASALLIDFGLPAPLALQLLAEWNARCEPPWSDDQLIEILAWADGRPSERGSKGHAGSYAASSARRSAEIDIGGLDLNLSTLPWDFRLHADGTTSCTPRPKLAILTPAELDSFPGGQVPATARCRVDRREPWPQGSGPEDDEDDEDDDEADTPVMVPVDDFPPECEAAYRYDCGSTCTCAFRVLFRNNASGTCQILRLPGRRWDCASCGPRRREHYKATMQHWLQDWAQETDGVDALSVYTAIVPAALWRKIASSLRIKGASFFRIDHLAQGSIPGGSYLVVSTESTSHIGWVKTTPRLALEGLHFAIDALPTDLRVRVWWSSRNWKLLPDRPPKDAEMERVGQLRASTKDLLEVLADWGKKTERVRVDGRFWHATGYRWHSDDAEWQLLKQDLADGISANKYVLELGLDPSNPPLGGDGTELIPDWPA